MVHTLTAVALVQFSPEVFWPYFNGAAIVLLWLFTARKEVSQAHGLEKIVALDRLCYATPIAVFGGEHLASARSIMLLVPRYMPARLFWAYFVGVCLIAAALSFVLNIKVRWSGTLLGIMFVLFFLMMDIEGVARHPRDRFAWALGVRQVAFACGAFSLAATYREGGLQERRPSVLVTLARIVLSIITIFYGAEHFLHPDHVPVVPLEMVVPGWIPASTVISYATGAAMVAAGTVMLFSGKNARTAAAYLGTLILLVIALVYLPILIASASATGPGEKIDALNYFMDTLFFGGTVLALANALPKNSSAG